jgi:hypothetical protein
MLQARGLSGMNRAVLLDHLAQVERHIREGERHLLHQREIVDGLERRGRGQSQTATMARVLLQSFEKTQLLHLNERVHLLLALQGS